MTEPQRWKELLEQLRAASQPDALAPLLRDAAAVDIALAMEELEPEQAIHVFDAIDEQRAPEVMSALSPDLAKVIAEHLHSDQLTQLVEQLPPRDAAALVAEAPSAVAKEVLDTAITLHDVARDAKHRLSYPAGSAGRLMTSEFVRLTPDMTAAQALDIVRSTDPGVDVPSNAYVVESSTEGEQRHDRLLGAISIRGLIMAEPNQHVRDIMETNLVTINATAEDDDAATLLSKYKFLTLPVLDRHDNLVGVIPADDVLQFVVARLHRRYATAVGTDASIMEHLSPVQAAARRVPWLLGTMVIELGAGLIIARFNHVLKEVILLASFMPVISAISGNVGLQAAAITVRGLDTGHISLKDRSAALWKESATTLCMAIVCGLTLGIIGAIWSRHLPFGLVIGGALSCSMLTAGVMGTIIPMVSKRLGFDPATTAGPFETAFQDVIGFGVFLWLATLMIHWIT